MAQPPTYASAQRNAPPTHAVTQPVTSSGFVCEMILRRATVSFSALRAIRFGENGLDGRPESVVFPAHAGRRKGECA